MGCLQLLALLLLRVISSALAAEESCEGRCFEGFNSSTKCQCDLLCTYYDSCCSDYGPICKSKETRGDVFAVPEDGYSEEYSDTLIEATFTPTEIPTSAIETTTAMDSATTAMMVTNATAMFTDTTPSTQDELCSGNSFDAFTNLKNGSIYSFRGKYFYELDDTKALEGYPKLIKDVWDIEGPIDAAFTRVNCQGKTYIFKGTKYWRFTDGVLDNSYPREISKGFSGIPDDIDAAFAIPANHYNGKEKAYFFKGSRYWLYEFQTQPSLRECVASTPSELFTQYLTVQDDSVEDIFEILFGSFKKSAHKGPWYISRDWRGVPSNVDAVLPSRIFIPVQTRSSTRRTKRRKSRRRNNRRRRPSDRTSWHFDLSDTLSSVLDDDELSDPDWLPPNSQPRCQPNQKVYFFKKDKYYRVNLQTKSVDKVYPRYPRPIAKYWLGCKSY